MVIVKTNPLAIYSASDKDRQKLANLVHFGGYIHRHLDWRPPLDWIGRQPYLVASRDGELLAALACPPDPPAIAWVRLFAVSSGHSPDDLWKELWSAASTQLAEIASPIRTVAIPLQSWFGRLLASSGFQTSHSVVVLTWEQKRLQEIRKDPSVLIRPMLLDDIPTVEKIDSAAFGGVWQNSRSSLEIAFRQSAVATVVELGGETVGYQISTATQMGGHLARLAVLPSHQNRGIGYALVHDMLSQFLRRGARSVTVNTQHDNLESLSLYKKIGFQLSGEEYPVYEFIPQK